MTVCEFCGYAASAMTLLAFAQKSMLPMRMAAIGANLAFITYGALGFFVPVLALHVILLPLNVLRLVHELRRTQSQSAERTSSSTAIAPEPAMAQAGLFSFV